MSRRRLLPIIVPLATPPASRLALPLAPRLALPLALLLAGTAPLGAQGTVRGQVLGGASRAPLPTAWVTVLRDGRRVGTDSLGRFTVASLAHGVHQLAIGAAGFRAETTEVDLDVDMLELSAVVLQPTVQSLEGMTVTGAASTAASRLSGFEERRKFGNGTFIDRATLDRFANRQTADVLQALAPGVSVRRGTSRKAWASSGRSPMTGAGAFGNAGRTSLDRADIAAGARPACYMDVYLNGALVYNSKGDQIPLFDLNSIPPDQVESIEAYASASQVPAQFNRTAGGCGVLVIWTR